MICRNYAHRGFSEQYPENTMPAFEAALEAGCEGIELDVQFSRDGRLVIIHDEAINRTSGRAGLVRELTFDELREIDFSFRFRKKFGFQRIPTLSEYFELIRDRDIITNIELKTGVFEYPGIEAAVLETIRKFGLEKKVLISSFNQRSVLRMKALAPEIACGFLSDRPIPNAGEYIRSHGVEAYHPHFCLLTKKAMDELRAHDIRINVWTVNRKSDIRRMIALGVDGIISNNLERTAAVLRKAGLR